MKISELIKGLQAMEEAYGDLLITTSHGTSGKAYTSEVIFLCYDQYEDHDEIQIRDYPY